MKRTPKYVALDVHQATTVVSVRDPGGRVIARNILPTEAEALVEFFRGMRVCLQVALEEGTQAEWVHDLLAPVVSQVVVCDRRASTAETRGISGRPTSSRTADIRSPYHQVVVDVIEGDDLRIRYGRA